MSREGERSTATVATKVVVSYPSDLDESGPAFLEGTPFQRYLGRAWDELEPGDERVETINLGCCTDATAVPFTVESVEGGTTVGPDTTFEFVRGDDPAGLGCDW